MASFHGGEISDTLWEELRNHLLHPIVLTYYGTCMEDIWNLSIECVQCFEVLIDVDNPELGGDHVAH